MDLGYSSEKNEFIESIYQKFKLFIFKIPFRIEKLISSLKKFFLAFYQGFEYFERAQSCSFLFSLHWLFFYTSPKMCLILIWCTEA